MKLQKKRKPVSFVDPKARFCTKSEKGDRLICPKGYSSLGKTRSENGHLYYFLSNLCRDCDTKKECSLNKDRARVYISASSLFISRLVQRKRRKHKRSAKEESRVTIDLPQNRGKSKGESERNYSSSSYLLQKNFCLRTKSKNKANFSGTSNRLAELKGVGKK